MWLSRVCICRFKREEIKIQAWESQEKAKLEAEMRRTEVIVLHMMLSSYLIGNTLVEVCYLYYWLAFD